MAELEDFSMKAKKNKGFWKKKREPKKKKRQLKRPAEESGAGRRKRGHCKKRPTKKRVDEL